MGATLLLLFFVSLRFSLPIFAIRNNNSGYHDYKRNKLSSAEAKYKRAIALDPGLSEAHYNLGLLYEDLQNYDLARTEYTLATKGGIIRAYNNLARLEVLTGRYREAYSLLQNSQVQEYLRDANAAPEDQYTLLKNTAWALQGLGFHQRAIEHLEQAIQINDQLDTKQASAYCLMGTSLKKLGKSEAASDAWNNCVYAAETSEALRNPEEYEWFLRARQHVQQLPEKLQ